MPQRTTVVFPAVLKRRAVSHARRKGISFGELVRRALEKELAPAPAKPRKKTGNSFLDRLVTFESGAGDLSTRIDEIVYGEDL